MAEQSMEQPIITYITIHVEITVWLITEQRIAFGINQDPKTWDLRWSALSNSNADAIETFFEARNGVESFDWSPIEDSDTYKWVCRSWQREHQYADISTITATFEEVFEP